MKGKRIGILICMMILAIIPIAAGMTAEPEPDTGTTDIGRTIVRGFFVNFKSIGLKNQFFAVRIHYSEITGTEFTSGIVRFSRVQVGKLTGGYIREGLTGMFGYMALATFKGGIEIL